MKKIIFFLWLGGCLWFAGLDWATWQFYAVGLSIIYLAYWCYSDDWGGETL